MYQIRGRYLSVWQGPPSSRGFGKECQALDLLLAGRRMNCQERPDLEHRDVSMPTLRADGQPDVNLFASLRLCVSWQPLILTNSHGFLA